MQEAIYQNLNYETWIQKILETWSLKFVPYAKYDNF